MLLQCMCMASYLDVILLQRLGSKNLPTAVKEVTPVELT